MNLSFISKCSQECEELNVSYFTFCLPFVFEGGNMGCVLQYVLSAFDFMVHKKFLLRG